MYGLHILLPCSPCRVVIYFPLSFFLFSQPYVFYFFFSASKADAPPTALFTAVRFFLFLFFFLICVPH
jgi:hypothetical protein